MSALPRKSKVDPASLRGRVTVVTGAVALDVWKAFHVGELARHYRFTAADGRRVPPFIIHICQAVQQAERCLTSQAHNYNIRKGHKRSIYEPKPSSKSERR